MNEYVYDAWGNHKIYKYLNGTILTDSSENPIDISGHSDYTNDIGNINPFRYRGYYFDPETGWYYLQSRYYDPQVRRFINADDPSVPVNDQAMVFGGLNLYAYCLNNPVMFTDSTGHFPLLITLILAGFTIAGGIVGGKASYDNAVSAGKTGADLFWSTVGGVFVGASFGLATGGLVVLGAEMIVIGTAGISAPLWGMTAYQVFAIGALAFNQFAFITAPLLGIQMDGIETVPNGGKTIVPKPDKVPRHSYGQIGFQQVPFNYNLLRYNIANYWVKNLLFNNK